MGRTREYHVMWNKPDTKKCFISYICGEKKDLKAEEELKEEEKGEKGGWEVGGRVGMIATHGGTCL